MTVPLRGDKRAKLILSAARDGSVLSSLDIQQPEPISVIMTARDGSVLSHPTITSAPPTSTVAA